jgi:hypothetical protein
MKMLKDLLDEKTVNGYKKDSTTVNSKDTDNSLTVADKIEEIIEEARITPEGMGKQFSEDLDDLNSERYYTLLATENPQGRLFEALSITKDADRRGVIRTKKAIYFLAILRRWGLKTKFKK